MTTEQKSGVAPSFLDELANRWGLQGRQYAKQLDEDNAVYTWYATLDAFNLAYSIPKYAFEIFLISQNDSTSPVHAVHEWLSSPAGIAIMLMETAALVSFSVLGTACKEDDENWFNRCAVFLWPYIRDLLKASKWAYKGWRSTLAAASLLLGEDLRYLLLPVGLALAALSVLNRFWSRGMKNARKDMMKNNANLYQEVSTKGCAFHLLNQRPPTADCDYDLLVLDEGMDFPNDLKKATLVQRGDEYWIGWDDGASYQYAALSQDIIESMNLPFGVEDELPYNKSFAALYQDIENTDYVPPVNKTYINSYIFLQGYTLAFNKPINGLAPNKLYVYENSGRIYYAVINHAGAIEETEIKQSECEVFAELLEDLQDDQNSDRNSLQIRYAEAIYKQTSAKGYGPKEKQPLHYVNEDGQLDVVNVHNPVQFESALKDLYQQNFTHALQRKLTKLKLEKGTWNREEVVNAELHFLATLPSAGDLSYANSFVYMQGKKQQKTQIFYIDPLGQPHAVRQDRCERFEQYLHSVRNNKNLLSPTQDQVQQLLEQHGGISPSKLGLNSSQWATYSLGVEAKIARQSALLKAECYASTFYGGVVDGMYTCMGILGLALFTPQFFFALAIFSAAMTAVFIVARLHEEYGFQLKLESSATKVKLILLEKKLDILLTELGDLSLVIATSEDDDDPDQRATDAEREQFFTTQDKLVNDLGATMNAFDECRELLKKQMALTFWTAGLEGLRNGLAAYSAVTSLMYMVATICLICAAPCPPMFVIGCAVAGVACLIGFTAQALFLHSAQAHKTTQQDPLAYKRLYDFITNLKDKKQKAYTVCSSEKIDGLKADLWGASIPSQDSLSWVDFWEMFRALLSGWGKGFKFLEWFTGSAVQDPQETPVLFVVSCLCSVGFAIVLFLRALARGFGRAAVDEVVDTNSASPPIELEQDNVSAPTPEEQHPPSKSSPPERKKTASYHPGLHKPSSDKAKESRKTDLARHKSISFFGSAHVHNKPSLGLNHSESSPSFESVDTSAGSQGYRPVPTLTRGLSGTN